MAYKYKLGQMLYPWGGNAGHRVEDRKRARGVNKYVLWNKHNDYFDEKGRYRPYWWTEAELEPIDEEDTTND